jgi:ribonuclease HI
MSSLRRRVLLLADVVADTLGRAQWSFTLHDVVTNETFSVSDDEPHANGERLELLAVVRGLEALEEPTRVTLLTRSQYVLRGLQRGLREWRRNQWRWERFGRFTPIRDCDLWLRIDHALEYHELDFGSLPGGEEAPTRSSVDRLDPPARLEGPHFLRRRRREIEANTEPNAEATFAPLSAANAEDEAVLIVRTRRERLADMAYA